MVAKKTCSVNLFKHKRALQALVRCSISFLCDPEKEEGAEGLRVSEAEVFQIFLEAEELQKASLAQLVLEAGPAVGAAGPEAWG